MDTAERQATNGRRRSGPYARVHTPAWSLDAYDRRSKRFDLRPTRDLSSRRLVREWARSILRFGLLIVGDVAACIAAHSLTVLALDLPGQEDLYFVPRLIVFVIFGQAAVGSYHAGRSHGGYGAVLAGAAAAVSARIVVDTLYDTTGLTLQAHVVIGVLLALMLCAWRFAVAQGVRAAYRRGVGQKRTLVVAGRDRAFEVIERFRAADEPRIRQMGHIVADPAQDPTAIGSLEDLPHLIEELDISFVVVAGELPRERFEQVVATCFMHCASVSVVPVTLTELPARITSRDILGWPLLELQTPRLHMFQVAIKRGMDVALSSLLIALASPLLAAIALAIRLESKGPVIFRQRRPGLGGKQFRMMKFRTMRPDAEDLLQKDPELYQRFLANDCKLPANEDPRISPLGRFLRATSLDELPQLFNVLRGDMSLIGPRPVVGPELRHYGEWTSTVLAVRPGMTGYWQVAGRSDVTYPERANLDIYYVQRWSLGLDLMILARTVPAVFRRIGAH